MEKIGIVIGYALLIGFILWWFFGKRTTSEAEAKVVDDGQAVTVAVDGGYTPNTVVLKKACLRKSFSIAKTHQAVFRTSCFPILVSTKHCRQEQYPIKIDTSKPGEYQYACGMNMFHGKVIIK